jgi:hypothetical protein
VDGNFKYYYDEKRSPRYAQENSRYGGSRVTPARFEVVDDRFRDDEHGSRRFSNTESKPGIRSSDFQKNMDTCGSPVVRPVRDVLGGSSTPLQVGDLSKAIDGTAADGSAHNQVHNCYVILEIWFCMNSSLFIFCFSFRLICPVMFSSFGLLLLCDLFHSRIQLCFFNWLHLLCIP